LIKIVFNIYENYERISAMNYAEKYKEKEITELLAEH